ATEYIKKNYGLDVNYTSFNINENQVNISKIQFTKDHKLKVNIDELILNYSLSKTIFKKKPIVNSIRIYNPKVKLIIDSLKSNGSKTKIPDLKEYFNKLYISDGEIDVKFISDQLSIEETIDSINVEVVNSISSKINMSAKIEDSYLDFEGMIVKNQLRYILNVENYSLKNIKSENAQDLSGLVNFNIFNDENIDNLELSGSNIHFKFNDNEFTFLDFEVDGNREKLMFNSQNCIADGNKCNVSANLFLQDTPQKFNANVLIPNLAISKYLPKVSGKLWSDITLQGNFEDLTIQSNLKSDSLLFFGQKLTEFRGVANYSNDVITFDFKHFKYLENKIKTNGFYNFEDGRLEAKSSSTKFRYSANSINFCGEIDVDYKLLNSKNNFYCNIRKAKIYNKHLIFDNLDGFATLNDGVYQINIDYADENFTFEASGNLDENYAKAQVNSTRFPPSKILKQVVSNNILLSTNIDISYKNDSLKTEGALRLYDKQFGKLDGNYNFCVNTNLKKKFTKFRFDSDFGVFNYEPFQIDFSGFADSTYLYTEEFTINNDIELDCEYNFKKSKLLTNVKGKEIDYINYLAYFMNKTEASFYDGKCDFDISYNSSDKGIFDGNIDFYDFKSDKDNELEVNLKLLGDNKKIRLVDSKIANKYHEQISLQGYYEFTKKEILFVANIQDIDSKNFLGNSINV
ncbi:MAG: hypothetical protein U9N34_07825, partial [Candidatus Cloacimonadota bacterium]|nr:hypothetical protein [Candidatus Cloacimonadota bacterium]